MDNVGPVLHAWRCVRLTIRSEKTGYLGRTRGRPSSYAHHMEQTRCLLVWLAVLARLCLADEHPEVAPERMYTLGVSPEWLLFSTFSDKRAM